MARTAVGAIGFSDITNQPGNTANGQVLTSTNNGTGVYWSSVVSSGGGVTLGQMNAAIAAISTNDFQGAANQSTNDLGSSAFLSTNTIIAMAGKTIAGSNYLTVVDTNNIVFQAGRAISGSNYLVTVDTNNIVFQAGIAIKGSNYLVTVDTNNIIYQTGKAISGSNYVTASITNGFTGTNGSFNGTFTGNGGGLTNLIHDVVVAGSNVTITSVTNVATGQITNTISSSGGGGGSVINVTNYTVLNYTHEKTGTGDTNVLIDFSSGHAFLLALTNNVRLVATNVSLWSYDIAAGAILQLTNNALGGWSVGYTNFYFPSGQILTITTNGGSRSVIGMLKDTDANHIDAVQTLNFQ